MAAAEQTYLGKVTRRIVPLFFVGILVGYIDRSNIAYASLRMNADLGLSPVAYGWAAGLFFLGYFCFEIPGTLALGRFGARAWMSFLVGCWGVLSMLLAFVHSVPLFFLLRFLLGVAEAGFFPGTIVCTAHWFPHRERARLGAYFMSAVPFAMVVSGPLSGFLMSHEGVGGLHGWQWLFMAEGVPCFFLAILMAFLLDDHPESATWLTSAERSYIAAEHREEVRHKIAPVTQSPSTLLRDGRLWLLLTVTFGGPAVATGITFWLPQTIASFGLSLMQVGLVGTLPFAVGGIALVLWGAHSDRAGECKWHLAIPLFVAAAGLVGTVALRLPAAKLAMLLIASLGMFSYLPVAWSASHAIFNGRAAAVGYGIVSMSGALAGLLSPALLGILRQYSGNQEIGILALAAIAFCGACGGLAFGNAIEAQPPIRSSVIAASAEN